MFRGNKLFHLPRSNNSLFMESVSLRKQHQAINNCPFIRVIRRSIDYPDRFQAPKFMAGAIRHSYRGSLDKGVHQQATSSGQAHGQPRHQAHDRSLSGWPGAGTPDEVASVAALLMGPDGWRRNGLPVVWRTRAAINKSGAAMPMTGISKSGWFRAHKNALGIAYETDTTV
jgi:hypothetical protein